jgi:WD40 repeat protein
VKKKEVKHSLKGHDGTHVDLGAFSSDGKRVATASGTEFYVWDVDSGELLYKRKHGPLYMRSLEFNSDASLLLSANVGGGDAKGFGAVWDAVSGNKLYELHDKSNFRPDLRAAIFSPNGKLIAQRWANDTIVISESAAGNTLHTIKKPKTSDENGSVIAFTADGIQLIAAYDDGTIRAINPTTGEILQTFQGPEHPLHIAISKDGRAMVVVSSEQKTPFVFKR